MLGAKQLPGTPASSTSNNVSREKSDRLDRWTLDPSIPAENKRAERELRTPVIARKISFGSQGKGQSRNLVI